MRDLQAFVLSQNLIIVVDYDVTFECFDLLIIKDEHEGLLGHLRIVSESEISNIINLLSMDNSFSSLYRKQSMNKIFIPGKYPGDGPQLVNAKQARRILIMRQKKSIKWLKQLDKGIYVNPKNEGGKFSLPRVKREDRVKLACNRKRVKGLFVTKSRELQIQQGLSEEDETYEPD